MAPANLIDGRAIARQIQGELVQRIAALKASLVAAYFMHLISEKKLIYAALTLTVVLFLVLMVLPVSHFADRGL